MPNTVQILKAKHKWDSVFILKNFHRVKLINTNKILCDSHYCKNTKGTLEFVPELVLMYQSILSRVNDGVCKGLEKFSTDLSTEINELNSAQVRKSISCLLRLSWGQRDTTDGLLRGLWLYQSRSVIIQERNQWLDLRREVWMERRGWFRERTDKTRLGYWLNGLEMLIKSHLCFVFSTWIVFRTQQSKNTYLLNGYSLYHL